MKKGIISRNISLLMEHFAIRNESQLAKLVGMPQTTINKLITGVSSDPRISTLTPIITHFKISLDTLLSDDPVFATVNLKQSSDVFVPVVTLEELGDIYANLNSLKTENWPQWYSIPKQNSHNYYAVHVSPKELLPPFQDASILIAKNESKLPQSGYCLIKHQRSNIISLKRVFFSSQVSRI